MFNSSLKDSRWSNSDLTRSCLFCTASLVEIAPLFSILFNWLFSLDSWANIVLSWATLRIFSSLDPNVWSMSPFNSWLMTTSCCLAFMFSEIAFDSLATEEDDWSKLFWTFPAASAYLLLTSISSSIFLLYWSLVLLRVSIVLLSADTFFLYSSILAFNSDKLEGFIVNPFPISFTNPI